MMEGGGGGAAEGSIPVNDNESSPQLFYALSNACGVRSVGGERVGSPGTSFCFTLFGEKAN